MGVYAYAYPSHSPTTAARMSITMPSTCGSPKLKKRPKPQGIVGELTRTQKEEPSAGRVREWVWSVLGEKGGVALHSEVGDGHGLRIPVGQ